MKPKRTSKRDPIYTCLGVPDTQHFWARTLTLMMERHFHFYFHVMLGFTVYGVYNQEQAMFALLAGDSRGCGRALTSASNRPYLSMSMMQDASGLIKKLFAKTF